MKRVVIESPFAGTDDLEVKRNIKYARACVLDSIRRREAPYASHLFFTQPGVLNDNTEDRKRGIDVGLEITRDFDLTAVYCDLGLSKGMIDGIERAKNLNRQIDERYLGDDWEIEYEKRVNNHPHKGFF